MLEAVTAIGLVALLLAGVYAGIQANERVFRHCVSQRQALDVLDNVVERLAAEAPVSLPRCTAVLAEELAPSPLAGQPDVHSLCEPAEAGIILCVIRDENHLLAEVRIGHREH